MRVIVLSFIAALGLAACGRSAPPGESAQNETPGGGVFPDLAQASYRAEATVTDNDGRTAPMVMIRSGGKLRMEVSAPEGNAIIITNAADGESIIISSMGGRQVAMQVNDADQFKDPAAEWGAELASAATRTGSCSVAGENGSEWTRSDEEGEQTTCVTADGIILRAGTAGRTTWETTRVERGPQDAALFEVPPGVQVLDLNNVRGMAEAFGRANDGD